MTIKKEPPGIWVAYCNHRSCGDRLEIDADPDDSFTEAAQALVDVHEWRRFKDGDGDWVNWCPDHNDEAITSLR
jgi:hypothetical protein